MHTPPQLDEAICDDPSFLIHDATKWCFPPNTKVNLFHLWHPTILVKLVTCRPRVWTTPRHTRR